MTQYTPTIVRTTRRSLALAMAQQPVNGLSIHAVGYIIFHPAPALWVVAKPGDMNRTHDRYFHSASDVLNALFSEVA